MERAYVQARIKLEKEIDVIEIIRMRRYLKAAMKMILSPEQVISLKNQCKFMGIDPDKDDSTSNVATNIVTPVDNQGKGTSQRNYTSESDIHKTDRHRSHSVRCNLELEQFNAGEPTQQNESSHQHLIPAASIIPVAKTEVQSPPYDYVSHQFSVKSHVTPLSAGKKDKSGQELPDIITLRSNGARGYAAN